MNIYIYLLIFSAACLLIAAILTIYNRRKTRKMLDQINTLLDSAINGCLAESHYDESVMSALESKLYQYLSSSEISARRTAEEKDKIKTLIADISHQTKTPISNIRLYSELLSEQALPVEASEYAEKIDSQSEKLSFLITSLVKLSRLETGILSLHPKENKLLPLLEEITAQYAGAAAQKGLTLHTDFLPEHSDLTAFFDEKWTAEALGNLVDNAIKYTEQGEIRLSVKKYEMFTCIEIRDTGMGISEDEQPKIFGRFYRSETAADQPGVGIGLYLAREIIAGQNGYIKVSSKPGKGSVFSVFLQNC